MLRGEPDQGARKNRRDVCRHTSREALVLMTRKNLSVGQMTGQESENLSGVEICGFEAPGETTPRCQLLAPNLCEVHV